MNRQGIIDWTEVRGRLQASERAVHDASNPNEADVQRLLQQRAQRLAKRRIEHGSGQDSLTVLVLRIGTQRYAVDLHTVVELGPLRQCTPVPNGPPELYGVMNHRGEVRSVIDLGRVLGQGNTQSSGHGFFVLMRRDGRELRLRVDTLEQILEIPRAAIAAAPESESPRNHRLGVTEEGIVILRAEALFSVTDAQRSRPKEQPTTPQVTGAQEENMSCA